MDKLNLNLLPIAFLVLQSGFRAVPRDLEEAGVGQTGGRRMRSQRLRRDGRPGVAQAPPGLRGEWGLNKNPDPEAGMAEMSEKFREKGGEIYLPAAE